MSVRRSFMMRRARTLVTSACGPACAVPGMSAACIVAAHLMGGCSIRYFDRETGTEHLWGFGHMKMRAVPPGEGLEGVVRSTETVGLAAGEDETGRFVSAGWQRRTRLQVTKEDSSFRIEWPAADLFQARIGSAPPIEMRGGGDGRIQSNQPASRPDESER